MKYKYIVGLFVALGFSNAFAADEEPIAKDNYQAMYEAFRCSSVKDINDALQNNQTFNHKNDTDIIRSSQTGLALRKAVIGLNADQLQAVVEKNHEFFKTSLGTSLIYGWTLNQFKEPVTPYYIGHYFSFDKLFQGLASKMVDHNVATFLKSAFTLGLSAVEADRWAFYDHMLYLPYAIEQVGIIGTSDLSIDDVIRMSRRTKAEANVEAKALQNANIPAIVIDDTAEEDELDAMLSIAEYLSAVPSDYSPVSYYESIKDAFSGDSVSAENFKKLQFLTGYITMGLGAEMAFLKSIDVRTKPIIQLDQNVTTSSGKKWFEGDRKEMTIGEMCSSVLEAVEHDINQEKRIAAAAVEEEERQERKRQKDIRLYDELYQVASTFEVATFVPENIKSIQQFAALLKKVLKMDETKHTLLQTLVSGMALENGKGAEKDARAKRRAALVDFVSKMKKIPEKFKKGETAYAK